MPKVLKIFICILAVALLTGMTFMIYNYRQEAQERSAHIAALSAEAKAYESELNQLKRETLDLWQSLGVTVDWASLLNGDMTVAQFQETYKQQFQDGLDAYFK